MSWRILQIWRNPVFHRFCRSRLRLRKSILWYLLTLIVTTFVVMLIYVIRTNSGTSAESAARSLWIPLLIIQGLLLMVKGTGNVSAGLIQDKIDQTLDYQRLTPMTPAQNLIGYLFGLPIQEYVLVALTLPHLLFIAVVGRIPLATLGSIYLVFFTCAMLYHLTGIAAGMVMRKWIWGYLLSICLVLLVNVVLPTFISQLGLSFVRYLSIWPVIAEKLLPVLVSPTDLARLSEQIPYFAAANTVPLFEWQLSALVFTLLLQGGLISTFAVMAMRRWKSATRHPLSKPFGLAVLSGFILLLIGNLWPAITGQYLPFALFGDLDFEAVKDVIGTAVPLVYSLAVWVPCTVLFAIVIPSHHDYIRGIRRALKSNRTAPRPWDDDAGGVGFTSLFAGIALLGMWLLFHELSKHGLRDAQSAAGSASWHLPTAFGLVIIYTLLVLQVMEMRLSALAGLLLWLLPILIAVIWGAAAQQFTVPQAVLASVSPLALIIMAGVLPFQALAESEPSENFAILAIGVYAGLVFVGLQIGGLWLRWRHLERAFLRECRAAEMVAR